MKKENVCEFLQKHTYKNQDQNLFYFSRKDYAKKIWNLIDKFGGSYSFFKMRRTGKTSFLVNELTDLASEKSYVFYFSFFTNAKNGEDVSFLFKKSLLEFALLVIAKKSLNHNISPHLKNKENKKFSISFLGVDLKFENNLIMDEDLNKIKNIQLNEIFNFMAQYSDQKILLLLDEFQELAKIKETEFFIKELRTELDLRNHFIHVIFTGSDYNALEDYFSKYSSPFFQFGSKMDFELLDDKFVKHCCDLVESEINQKIDFDNLNKIFKDLGSFPVVLIDICKKMIFHNDPNPENYINDNALNIENIEYFKIWNTLSLLEKAILFKISQNENIKMHNINNIHFYEKICGSDKEINKNKIHYCLSKLRNKNIIFKDKQSWHFIEKSFKRFINDFIYNEGKIK